MWPTYLAKSKPLTAPAMVPMPVTEPTALRGNISEAVVKRLAGPALMRGGGQAEQSDGGPFSEVVGVKIIDQKNGNDEAGAEQHGRQPRALGGKSHADEGRGQIAAVDAADGRGVVDDENRQSQTDQAQMKFIAEVTRQPVEIEPPDGIGEEFGNGIGPGLTECRRA